MWYFANGDAGFYFIEQFKQLSWLPVVWHPEYGFGVSALARTWFDYPYGLIIKALSSVGLSWWSIDKLLWISAFLIAAVSSYKLAQYILHGKRSAALAAFIYTTNTYMLLLFSGGQIGVALAYALSPLVLLKFIQAVNELPFDFAQGRRVTGYGLKQGIKNGLWLALLIAFDLRFAYLVVLSIGLYTFLRVTGCARLHRQGLRVTINQLFHSFIIPGIVAASVHMFWILPIILVRGASASIGEQFTSPGMLQFLSFADFSHAISFLHPNWPENLFGKVYFLQPEFLVLPIIAFSSLAWIGQKAINSKHSNRLSFSVYCPFFALLALIGAFFAKGVQEPFGGIFQWMFIHIPGFVMFRDPTKFYLFTAIGYSILIPFTLMQFGLYISRFIKKNSLFIIHYSLFIIFIVFWCFTIRAVFVGPFGFAQGGQVAGNFRPLTLTPEYIQLKDELVNDTVPSRTLWIPGADKFVFSSDIHPVLSSDELFPNASVSAMIPIINSQDFENTIRENGVGYIIVPQDLEKKMFLTDYKFDPMLRKNLIDALNKSSLQRVPAYNGLKVYKSDHDPMIINRPQNIEAQQHWANVGAAISAISLIIISGSLLIIPK